MNRIFFAIALTLLVNLPAAAQDGQWKLVCFTQGGLEKVLSKVVNAQQFLRNSMGQTVSKREMGRAGCDYAQVPAGSVANPTGFYTSREGFIFPTFQLWYRTTNQRMYSADGIFEAESWDVVDVKTNYIGRDGEVQLRRDRTTRNRLVRPEELRLLPRNYQVAQEYLYQTGGFVPDYVVMPESYLSQQTTGARPEPRRLPMTPEQEIMQELLRRMQQGR